MIAWDAFEKYDIRFEATEIDRLIQCQINDDPRLERTALIVRLAREAISTLECFLHDIQAYGGTALEDALRQIDKLSEIDA